jgi:UDPglucose--hexose-1-phosphate uridylyltransferase
MDRRIDELARRPTVIVGSQRRPNLPAASARCGRLGLSPTTSSGSRTDGRPARSAADGAHPDHDAEFWTLGRAGAGWSICGPRTAALGARDDVAYVLVFENRGPEVGATIAHPHGQIYAYEQVPPEPLRELVDGVRDVEHRPTELIVSSAGDWTAGVPAAAVWPYELRVAAGPGIGALTDAACDRDGLAEVLIDVLARLDQLFDAPMPYMMWFHQRPTDGGDWPAARLHLHICPLYRAPGVQRFVASAELGGGVTFNPIEPAAAAAALRGCAGAPDGAA